LATMAAQPDWVAKLFGQGNWTEDGLRKAYAKGLKTQGNWVGQYDVELMMKLMKDCGDFTIRVTSPTEKAYKNTRNNELVLVNCDNSHYKYVLQDKNMFNVKESLIKHPLAQCAMKDTWFVRSESENGWMKAEIKFKSVDVKKWTKYTVTYKTDEKTVVVSAEDFKLVQLNPDCFYVFTGLVSTNFNICMCLSIAALVFLNVMRIAADTNSLPDKLVLVPYDMTWRDESKRAMKQDIFWAAKHEVTLGEYLLHDAGCAQENDRLRTTGNMRSFEFEPKRDCTE
jgi:hypothetical protein